MHIRVALPQLHIVPGRVRPDKGFQLAPAALTELDCFST